MAVGPLLLSACSGGNTTAATMHLRRPEGTVAVSNADGKDLPPLDHLSLYSGYGVNTQSASYAWVDLDDVKLDLMRAIPSILATLTSTTTAHGTDERRFFRAECFIKHSARFVRIHIAWSMTFPMVAAASRFIRRVVRPRSTARNYYAKDTLISNSNSQLH